MLLFCGVLKKKISNFNHFFCQIKQYKFKIVRLLAFRINIHRLNRFHFFYFKNQLCQKNTIYSFKINCVKDKIGPVLSDTFLSVRLGQTQPKFLKYRKYLVLFWIMITFTRFGLNIKTKFKNQVHLTVCRVSSVIRLFNFSKKKDYIGVYFFFTIILYSFSFGENYTILENFTFGKIKTIFSFLSCDVKFDCCQKLKKSTYDRFTYFFYKYLALSVFPGHLNPKNNYVTNCKKYTRNLISVLFSDNMKS